MTLRTLVWYSSFLSAVFAANAVGRKQATFIVFRGDNDPTPAATVATQTPAATVATQTATANATAAPAAAETTAAPAAAETTAAPAAVPTTTKQSGWFGCEDKPPESTGFEVHTSEGFLGFASCTDLAGKCHNWINSTRVQLACPVSCYIC